MRRDNSILTQFGIQPQGFVLYAASRGKQEWHGPCWSTSCRTDPNNHDRMTVTQGSFKYTDLGLFRCRICGEKGKLDDLVSKSSDIDWKSVQKEQRRAAELAAQEEEAKRQGLVTWLNTDRVDWHLHRKIWDYPEVIEDLERDGIGTKEIEKWWIGYTPSFNYMIDGQRRKGPAISFPITFENQLLNIRMRLLDQVNGNKYRPIRAGLGIQFFSAIYPSDHRLFIVEGEKKAIVLHSYGISCIGLYGVEVWKPEWGKYLKKRFKSIYVLFDNEPNRSVLRAAEKIRKDTGGKKLWVPGKPDDYMSKVRNVNAFFESMRSKPNEE